LKHQTEIFGHDKHYWKPKLESHWGYMLYGPIFPHDADAKYPESEKAKKPAAKAATRAQAVPILTK
jgi:hypothetical protein